MANNGKPVWEHHSSEICPVCKGVLGWWKATENQSGMRSKTEWTPCPFHYNDGSYIGDEERKRIQRLTEENKE